MKNLMVTCSLVLVAFCGAQAAKADTCNGAAANLITNCGFETGDFTGWSGTTTTDPGSGVSPIDPVNQSLPYEGNYEAVLGTLDATSTLSQTIATVPGQQYTIQFALANDYTPTTGYTDSFAADFGSSMLLLGTNDSAMPFHLYSFTETATGSSTALSFTNENDGGFWDLDSVSVVGPAATSVTPEPSSLLLLGTGLLGTMGAIRRRLHA